MDRLRSGPRHAGLLLALAALFCSPVLPCVSLSAFAQQPAPRAPETANQARAPAESAALIKDLIAGKLSAAVDPSELFQASFAPAGLDRARLVLRLVDDPDLLKAASTGADDPLWSDIPADTVALASAQAEFLRLPERQRERLLTDHETRRAKDLEAAREAQSVEQRRLDLQQRADALQRFLDGERTDLALLDFQLLDPQEIALRPDRRKTSTDAPAPEAAPATTPDATQPELPPQSVEAAQTLLDNLRARLFAFPP